MSKFENFAYCVFVCINLKTIHTFVDIFVTNDYYTNYDDKRGLDRYNEIESCFNPDGSNTSGLITEEDTLSVLFDNENAIFTFDFSYLD